MPGYYGHVEDVDLSIYRGAYKLKYFYINKLDSVTQKQTKFFDVPLTDLSVEWRSLFHGKIVGNIIFDRPTLAFTKDKVTLEEAKADTATFQSLLKDFMPLRLNRFEVRDGTLRYVDSSYTPVVDVRMTRILMLAQNLTNVKDTGILPASIKAQANVYDGQFTMNMKMDPVADKSTFDLNCELKGASLPKFNSFFKAYGKFDVSEGIFGLYMELASDKGKYVGYAKPVIKELKVTGPEDYNDSFWQKMWEGVIGAAGGLLKNHKTDQIATKIPMEGDINNSKQDFTYAIVDLLRNAFIQALTASIDNVININSVNNPPKENKGFFKRLFEKDEKDKKKNDKEEKSGKESTESKRK